jgi:hypothetical protein
MNAKLGDSVAHRSNVAEKTSLKPLDLRDHNTSNRGVCHGVEPFGEIGERFGSGHGGNVIERLHSVKFESESKFA